MSSSLTWSTQDFVVWNAFILINDVKYERFYMLMESLWNLHGFHLSLTSFVVSISVNRDILLRWYLVLLSNVGGGQFWNYTFWDIYLIPLICIYFAGKTCNGQQNLKQLASIAQWQSTALVKQGSWVQSSLGATLFFREKWHFFIEKWRFWHFELHNICNLLKECLPVILPRRSWFSLHSSVVEHWSRKPGIVSSIPTGGLDIFRP